jgi:hypothetical protein
VLSENSAYDILVEFQAKSEIDLLRNTATSLSLITAFHFDNGRLFI